MLRLGEKLPALRVFDAEDRVVALSALHADAPLVAIFLRHFG